MRVLCCRCEPGNLGLQIDDYLYSCEGQAEDIRQKETDLTRFEDFALNEMSSAWVSVEVSEIAGFLRQQPIGDRSRIYGTIVDFFEQLGTRGIIVHPPFLMNDPSPLQMDNGS